MSLKSKLCTSAVIFTAFLAACGGGSSGSSSSPPVSPPPPAADTTPPAVAFSPATLTVQSGQTGTSTLTATDAVGVTSGPSVTCTNGGSFDVATNTFTAAIITADTTSVCTATAGDAAGNEGTATLTVTMTVPTTVSFGGTVYKGPITGATMNVFDAEYGGNAEPLITATTSLGGGFSLTIPEGTQTSNLLVLEALIGGATMVCDAANCLNEGGIAFGESFLIPADDPNAGERTLAAAIPTPAVGTTNANVNMFTHYQILDMVAQAFIRSNQQGGEVIISLDDYSSTRANTARIFGLADTDFFSIPFVDITQPITSTDSDAIYAALLSGGLLGAALEAIAPFDAITDFQNRGVNYAVIANELNNNREMISIEDIFENALALAEQIGETGNAFTTAQDALTARKAEISAAPADRFITPDGNLPPFVTDLTFFSDSRSFTTAVSSVLLSVVNPDSLNYTATLEAGEGSEFFNVAFDTPSLLEVGLVNGQNNIPAGTYNLSVTFDTEEGEPNTDTIELIFTSPELGIVEDSITISKAVTDRADVTINNPDGFQISDVTLSGDGVQNFVSAFGPDTVEISLNGADPVPNGTYNLTVNIVTTTVGVSESDTLEVIVTD